MTMKKKLKHFLIMIAAVLFISTPSSVLANTHDAVNTPTTLIIDGKKETLKTIQDDENVRIVESVNEAGKKSVATFDKVKNTMLMENEGEEPVFIDLSKAMDLKGQIENDEIKVGTQASVVSEYTYSDYEYEITMSNPKKWKILRPKPSGSGQFYKQTTQGTHNSTNLESFKSSVDQIDELEKTAIGILGFSVVVAALITIASAGIASAAVWAAFGISVAEIGILVALDSACADAEWYYGEV